MDPVVQDIADHLKVLADPARLRILKELMVVKAEKNVCVRDLAERLEISQPNVSHHLKVLKSAGFISCKKPCHEDQRYAYYSVDRAKIEGLFSNVIESIS
ncbi:MAG: ArsR family transcriptional regulator [Gemmatimonadetes bacterium]|mgnify:CR=1 FL=1|nr:ArsR family transcriptional regulator [Gemmatimonadota bacterium]|tara:strand:- start:6380 stop:6679 length:300 start_codon:yes stop_codon:yes gene_type:complete